MLYDPKWDSVSLAGFISWLETQDPTRPYSYWPCATCAIGQYLRATGKSEADAGVADVYFDWNQDIAGPQPHTFGAALDRARKLAAA